MQKVETYDLVVVGGGAAGFFCAINAAMQHPTWRIVILERGKNVLEKVRISGGGRCNVTHACFVPNELAKFYPRGNKELLSPFHTFCSGDTVDWFDKKGVELKIEEDNRMFPVSNSSETIIDCFLQQVKKYKIQVQTSTRVDDVRPPKDAHVNYWVKTQEIDYKTPRLVLATGSNPSAWAMIAKLGHSIVPAVPSLFTFNIKDKRLTDLLGISLEKVMVEIPQLKQNAEGSLLITHWGLSGPGILKLSAWAARELHALNYHFTLKVNFLCYRKFDDVLEEINVLKLRLSKKNVTTFSPFPMPQRLWKRLCEAANVRENQNWADMNKGQMKDLTLQLIDCQFQVTGKSTFKDEFVTAGGVDLKEIDFKRFESKIHQNLFIVGESLNIDAVTGGFNFQAAWTGAYIAANAMNTVQNAEK